MKVVVFGGSGFLGSHVADALTDKGYEVIIFDKVPSPYLRDKQKMVVGDLLDREKIKSVVQNTRYVYHFAGVADIKASSEIPWETLNVNIMGTCNILEACVEAGVDRFVFASSIYVYSELGSFYRVSKQACEKLIEEYANAFGLKYSILRYGSLYGPRANHFNSIRQMLKQALTEGIITRRGDGEEIREYVYAIDAASESVNILEDQFENKHIVITGNQPMKIKELLTTIREILGNKIKIEYLPSENQYHYEITPYSYKPQIAIRLIPQLYHDLGQGLLELLHDLEEEEFKMKHPNRIGLRDKK